MTAQPRNIPEGVSKRSKHGPRYTLIRQHNHRAVMELFLSGETMSRPDLAEGSHLSVPTVDVAVDYLIGRGLVERVGQRRGGVGRSAAMFRLRSDAAKIVAVDVGVRRWRISVSDLAGGESRHELIPAPPVGQALVGLTRLVDELVDQSNSENTVVAVGTPGVPDPTTGRLQFVENLPDLVDVPLNEVLEQNVRSAVVVENDVNLAALAEQCEGQAQGCDNFVFISVGNGVGMGAVVDGRPLRGARGAAGELGLLPFPVQPASIEVRRHGALESAIGADAIRRRARDLLKAGERSVLKQRASVEDVLAAASDGDRVALMIVREVAAALATAVAAAVVVLDSELVVLGGGIGSQQVVVDAVDAALRSILAQPVRLVPSALRAEATLVGARVRGREVLLAQVMESIT